MLLRPGGQSEGHGGALRRARYASRAGAPGAAAPRGASTARAPQRPALQWTSCTATARQSSLAPKGSTSRAKSSSAASTAQSPEGPRTGRAGGAHRGGPGNEGNGGETSASAQDHALAAGEAAAATSSAASAAGAGAAAAKPCSECRSRAQLRRASVGMTPSRVAFARCFCLELHLDPLLCQLSSPGVESLCRPHLEGVHKACKELPSSMPEKRASKSSLHAWRGQQRSLCCNPPRQSIASRSSHGTPPAKRPRPYGG